MPSRSPRVHYVTRFKTSQWLVAKCGRKGFSVYSTDVMHGSRECDTMKDKFVIEFTTHESRVTCEMCKTRLLYEHDIRSRPREGAKATT
jgi:hypothetical protein